MKRRHARLAQKQNPRGIGEKTKKSERKEGYGRWVAFLYAIAIL